MAGEAPVPIRRALSITQLPNFYDDVNIHRVKDSRQKIARLLRRRIARKTSI
jgi:hypothetical protein